MREDYDYIVIGLGCSGLSSLQKLSKKNKTLGIDMHGIQNAKGSSHGNSRIYRLSYYEGEKYLPLLKKSYSMWKKIEEKTNREILIENGFMFLDNEGGEKIKKCQKSCFSGSINYEKIRKEQINQKTQEWNLKQNCEAIYHQKGGILKSNEALEAYKELCLKNGADIIKDKVNNFNIKRNKIKISLKNGGKYSANKIIVATGPWSKKQFSVLDQILEINKHLACFYKTPDHALNGIPWISYMGKNHFYGLPDSSYTYKIGKISSNRKNTKDNMENFYNEQDNKNKRISKNKNFVNNKMNINYKYQNYQCCPTTNTPDENYIIDCHPSTNKIIFCCGMSGHGFKTSPYNGKIVQDLCLNNYNKYSNKLFNIDRF